MKWLWLTLAVCALQTSARSLDRGAFTFTNYSLTARIEPEQQRIGVRGRVTLRNDSTSSQKYACLQISSSLGWRSIQVDRKPIEFISQIYTSDIDHTGALSEAIVTLPQEVAPHGSIELDVGYEGTISLDTTRLERIGVPKEVAKHNDWDEIGKSFTAVRGVGYVTWYPVAMESANLSDENAVTETVGRWTQRHAESTMMVTFESTSRDQIFFSGTPDVFSVNADKDIVKVAVFSVVRFGINVPTFVIGNYQMLPATDMSTIAYMPGHGDASKAYADVMTKLDLFLPVGGKPHLQVIELSDPDAASFVTEGTLLIPFKPSVTPDVELTLVYAFSRQLVRSPRPWIQEGLAHLAQVLHIEQLHGRQKALDYLNVHRAILLNAEKTETTSPPAVGNNREVDHSLINGQDDIYLQTKAMNVWWMLRDMLGGLNGLVEYKAQEDKDPAYMQRLLEKQTHKDLEWFFDDWVYRDHGLPDFRVDSVYPRKLVNGGYLVTVTVENLGGAGAEVPVTLRTDTEEISKRLEVHAKSKASIRIETVTIPREVVVNDGSVPESDMSNNSYKVVLSAN
ncbi:MAG TPA: hypothetical protein VGN39_09270 [Terriglobales bacterium]|jgi:hypothetical protein|nr:hypothetical protein [Terriglobales bacterium]